MPSDKMLDILPSAAIPGMGKGALDTRRFCGGNSYPDTELEQYGAAPRDEEVSKPCTLKADACQRLSLCVLGKAGIQQMACRAEVRTGLGKSDRPGSQGGLWERGSWESD
jgi:hypothetical protein